MRADVRGQRSEVRGQRSEVRGQRSEVRGQKSEVRSRKSEVGSQKSEVGGRKSGTRTSDLTSDLRPPGSLHNPPADLSKSVRFSAPAMACCRQCFWPRFSSPGGIGSSP